MKNDSHSAATPEQIADLIRRRETLKVLGSVEQPVTITEPSANANDAKVLASIASAGWAPFHYDRAIDGVAEPWRVHVVWHQDCRCIAGKFHQWFDDVKPSNKLPAMLSACGALVLVTWLPQFKSGFGSGSNDESVAPDKQVSVDEEHLAATSAMIQNMLLVLTAHGMGTYWSSGGQFRTPTMFEQLGIKGNESLLAAVFIEYPETMSQPIDRLAGKQRENRSAEAKWIREVRLS
jgi:nitroreductase